MGPCLSRPGLGAPHERFRTHWEKVTKTLFHFEGDIFMYISVCTCIQWSEYMCLCMWRYLCVHAHGGVYICVWCAGVARIYACVHVYIHSR